MDAHPKTMNMLRIVETKLFSASSPRCLLSQYITIYELSFREVKVRHVGEYEVNSLNFGSTSGDRLNLHLQSLIPAKL